MAEGDNYDEAKLDEVERLLGKKYSHAQIAEEMRTSTKTVQRHARVLESRNRLVKDKIASSQEMRDEAFEQTLDTYAAIRRAIRRNERLQDALEAEIGFKGDWTHDPKEGACKCCGRLPLRTNDPLKWNAAFKGGDTLNSQITTLMKALGQIQENSLILVQQLDEDAMVIIEELVKVGQLIDAESALDEGRQLTASEVLKLVSRNIYNRLVERSRRRRERLPEYLDVIEGEYRLLGEGVDVQENR